MAFASMIDQTAICITTVSLLCSPRRKKPTSTGALSDSIVLNADSVLRTRTHTHTHTQVTRRHRQYFQSIRIIGKARVSRCSRRTLALMRRGRSDRAHRMRPSPQGRVQPAAAQPLAQKDARRQRHLRASLRLPTRWAPYSTARWRCRWRVSCCRGGWDWGCGWGSARKRECVYS